MLFRDEAIILRTWPVHEADLIVSFFTREGGRRKGVAKSASKSRKRFGGALEPMTHVTANYAIRPRQELVRLDSLEILHSPLAEPTDYATRVGRIWMPVTYFAMWMVRLMGWMPETRACNACRKRFAQDAPAYWHNDTDGLFCDEHRKLGAFTLGPESRRLAEEMLHAPPAQFATDPWPRSRALDLRRFAFYSLERHGEQRLQSVQALGRLSG
jgi:DNA repair protein RecO (recombination protein O)